MQTVRSSTPLEGVHVEPFGVGTSEVWLFADIREVEEDGATYWEAGTVNGIVSGIPTVEEVEADFDAYWEAFERAPMTDKERIDEVSAIVEQTQAQVLYTAIMTDTYLDDVEDDDE